MNRKTYRDKPQPFPADIAHNPKPKPIPSTHRPPLAQSASAWSSAQLSTKPFWESGGTSSASSSPSPKQNQQQQQQQQQQHSNPVAAPPSPPSAAAHWGTHPPQEHSTAAPLPSQPFAAVHPQQPSPVPSPQSSTALGSQQSSSSPPSSMSRKQRRSLDSYASKYATRPPPVAEVVAAAATTASPRSSLSPAAIPFTPSVDFSAVTPTAAPAPAAPAPALAMATPYEHATEPEPIVISGTISLADLLAPTPPEPPAQKPLFELDIELIPGVSTLLPVYEMDNYTALVKQFAAKHHLSIAPDAERLFANKIQQMVSELEKLEAQQQLLMGKS